VERITEPAKLKAATTYNAAADHSIETNVIFAAAKKR